ncbi:MAG TPA: FAD-dependent oxidoreductase [Thermoanaerobaculia bacterium]|nr:FAD-dependent oxidoreductase [Thermoanaerobaculia bacterium]
MNTDNGETRSIWMETADTRAEPPLAADVDVDVCIVGAGIAGMTTAYLLSREGQRVVVLDDGPVAGGETCRTTAHLVTAPDWWFDEIARKHGKPAARVAAESHGAAVDSIEENVRREGISCSFERLDGYLFVAPGDSTDTLEKELEAAHEAGQRDVELVTKVPVSFETGPALRFPRQGQFHILEYVKGLARAIETNGGRIYRETHADEIEGVSDASGLVRTSGGATVRARAVVVATNSPVNDRVVIHTKQAPYRTYVVGARVARGSVPRLLLWDTGDPYHYVRLQPVDEGHDLLIVGGEDHKTGQATDMGNRWRRLEAWMRERFPAAGKLEYQWSGQVLEPVDGLAYIGPNPMDKASIFVATGFSGTGMTYGTISGMLLTDLIQGRENAWAKTYDPSRVTLGAAKEFAEENLNVAAQYGDLVTGGEVESTGNIKRGTGSILRRGLTKVAVYRDEDGALHERSAICPHLGCVVDWNPGEKTWDCPCHGSRYHRDGHVVNGPANRGLSEVEE